MLRKGQKFTLGRASWRVAYVNASRAHCVCTTKQTVTIKGRTFVAHASRTLDISQDSHVALLRELEEGHNAPLR